MVKLGNLILKVVTDEAIDQSNQVTTKPVERGADISDHIFQDPVKIDLSVSVAGETAAVIFQQLEAMRNAQEIFDYYGEQRAEPFKSMAIERVSLERNPMIANGHQIKLSLKQVRIVEQQTTMIKLGKDPITQKQPTTKATTIRNKNQQSTS